MANNNDLDTMEMETETGATGAKGFFRKLGHGMKRVITNPVFTAAVGAVGGALATLVGVKLTNRHSSESDDEFEPDSEPSDTDEDL